MTIEYRYEDGEVAGRMSDVERHGYAGSDAGELLAQRYMSQFPSIASAHVFTDGLEIVVSRATEWQKRNG